MAPRLILVAALLAAGCTCVSDSDCPLDEMCTDGRCVARPSGHDTTPPTATVTAPAAGLVSGVVTLTAAASDDVGVASVDFAVDGAIVATATGGASYSVTWNSGSVWNAPHAITAIAHDAAGNTGTSAALSVSVANYPGAALSVHTTIGLADAATSDPSNKDHFLSVKHQYVLSYSGTRRTPNWVSWELDTNWMGNIARQNDFRPDDTFPAGFPQAQLADFLNSGWDRGHMCPSEDRTATLLDNQNTFYLTNMVPQAANNNRGPWEDLESELRTIAQGGKELFIIAGGVYSSSSTTIGTGVSVPDKTFKVVVVLDAIGQGAADVTTSTRVIAVMMPNSNSLIGLSDPWRNFRVSVDAIEAATGDDFLSDVDPAVQAVIEARVDNQ